MYKIVYRTKRVAVTHAQNLFLLRILKRNITTMQMIQNVKGGQVIKTQQQPKRSERKSVNINNTYKEQRNNRFITISVRHQIRMFMTRRCARALAHIRSLTSTIVNKNSIIKSLQFNLLSMLQIRLIYELFYSASFSFCIIVILFLRIYCPQTMKCVE